MPARARASSGVGSPETLGREFIASVTWIPAQCCGSSEPSEAVIVEPQSPPCAPYRVYPRRAIKVAHADAIRSTPQPVVVGFAEKPNPGMERTDHVKRVRGVTTVRGGIGQRFDHLIK